MWMTFVLYAAASVVCNDAMQHMLWLENYVCAVSHDSSTQQSARLSLPPA